MSIFYTDETALGYWREASMKCSSLLKARPSRMASVPCDINTQEELEKACQDFHHDDDPIHVLVGSKGARRQSPSVRYHYFAGNLPTGSCFQLNSGVYVASPEFLFVRMGSKLPFIELVVLGCEMSGTYCPAIVDELDPRGFHNLSALTSKQRLKRHINKCAGFNGVKRAKQAVRYILDGSASPMETEVGLLMSLPKRYGGYGLPAPSMNHKVYYRADDEVVKAKAPNKARRPKPTSARSPKSFNGSKGTDTPPPSFYKIDLYWPTYAVAVEYDSDMWHSGTEKLSMDSERRNRLRSLGIDVTSLTNSECKSVAKMDRFCATLAKRLGKRETPDPDDYPKRKEALRAALLEIRSRNLPAKDDEGQDGNFKSPEMKSFSDSAWHFDPELWVC